jgi:hypothetical protein
MTRARRAIKRAKRVVAKATRKARSARVRTTARSMKVVVVNKPKRF